MSDKFVLLFFHFVVNSMFTSESFSLIRETFLYLLFSICFILE